MDGDGRHGHVGRLLEGKGREMKNWKTTLIGVLAIISTLAGAATAILNGHHIDGAFLTSTLTGIMTGVGLIKAADAKAQQ